MIVSICTQNFIHNHFEGNTALLQQTFSYNPLLKPLFLTTLSS